MTDKILFGLQSAHFRYEDTLCDGFLDSSMASTLYLYFRASRYSHQIRKRGIKSAVTLSKYSYQTEEH